MTKDELKLAFQKAFQMGQDYWYYANHEFESYNKKSDAIRAKFNEMVKETIEEALAEQEQEPVVCCQQYDTCLHPCTPRGEHLAQRTWVGLSEDELERLIHNFGNDPHTLLDEVDARLRNRNT